MDKEEMIVTSSRASDACGLSVPYFISFTFSGVQETSRETGCDRGRPPCTSGTKRPVQAEKGSNGAMRQTGIE